MPARGNDPPEASATTHMTTGDFGISWVVAKVIVVCACAGRTLDTFGNVERGLVSDAVED